MEYLTVSPCLVFQWTPTNPFASWRFQAAFDGPPRTGRWSEPWHDLRPSPSRYRSIAGSGRFRLPEALLLHTDDVILIERAMSNLSSRFRELLVLRELEELSYQEVADVMGVPIGTVMSGLSRARQALRGALDSELKRCPGME